MAMFLPTIYPTDRSAGDRSHPIPNIGPPNDRIPSMADPQRANPCCASFIIAPVNPARLRIFNPCFPSASLSSEERSRAIDFHKVWVDTASKIGCHSIRINLNSNDGTAEEVQEVCSESISKLIEYSSQSNISVVIENHGGLTGNGKWLSGLIKNINNEFVGSLPDFGDFNFCQTRGDLNFDVDRECEMKYDKYLGVEELIPYAKGISAKSHDFDKNGNETKTDYKRMMKIIKNSDFEGYMAIEYEGAMLSLFGDKGNYLSPHEGVLASKALLEKLI